MLSKSIKQGVAQLRMGGRWNRFDPVWGEPQLHQALLRWRLLGWFSESENTGHVSDSYTGGLMTWLLDNNAAMEELLMTLTPKDDASLVPKLLMDSWSNIYGLLEKQMQLTGDPNARREIGQLYDRALRDYCGTSPDSKRWRRITSVS